MARLIDADLLKKNIAKWLQGGDPQETEMVKVDDIAVSVIMEIDEQPNAFDIDKVVDGLKDKAKWIEYKTEDGLVMKQRVIPLAEAVNEVRKGGVE